MIVDRFLHVKFDELTLRERKQLEKRLTFGKKNGDVVISYRRLLNKGEFEYLLPRGAWYLLPDSIVYKDNRSRPKMPKLKSNIKLDAVELDPRYEGQSMAVEAMMREQQGLIIRPPGTGKTQIAVKFAADCETRTLVLVHTEDILEQWVTYLNEALPGIEIGKIRGQTCRIGHVTVATVQTLNRSYLDKGEKWWAQFGAIIADEAHHVSAATWEAVLNACPAYYRFGFTASPTRADGMHPTMRFIIGPVIHRQKFTSPVKLQVVPIKTDVKIPYRGAFDWSNLLTRLVQNPKRNRTIARIVDREIEAGNSVLVLSRRIEHLEGIADAMVEDAEILAAAKVSKAERKRILASFKSGETRCVLATQLADEALDVPRLNRICLTFPGKHEGRIIQQIGRALRKFPEKEDAIIYDFVDNKIGVLKRQWKMRRQTYIKEKISIRKERKLTWR